MESATFINPIDRHLKVVAETTGDPKDERHCRLRLRLFHDNTDVGTLDFTVSGYTPDELKALAGNIRGNAFLMKEIDDYLCGEM